jgi:hypothetical protein
MGLEPMTFCMASRPSLLGRGRFVPANCALLRPGDESFFPRVSSRFDGVVSPIVPGIMYRRGAAHPRAWDASKVAGAHAFDRAPCVAE